MENPKIRFKGFTKDWEQRKLIDYLEVSSEKNRDNRFTKDDVLSVSGEYGIVNQIEFQGRSFAGASVSNYGVVENGDVVYTKSPLKSNPYGIIKTNKGIPGIVSTLYAVYKPKEITDSKFVQIYFELDSRMNSYMHPLVNKGAKNDMKVSAENALKGMVSFPKKDEQEMISLYFSNLDHLITLHQRKCEQTKNLKKYMLQKMFPQNGAKVPEIRFNGFTHDWEQRKFGSLLEETRNKTIFEDEDTLLSCAIDGMYLNSELFSHFRGSSNIGYLKVKKNDLILSAQNLHLGNCNVNLRFEHGIISPAYKVYELVGCNPLFMQAWVKKDSTKDFFLKSSTEGASVCRKNIVWEELYKQELPVPSIEEQTKVGEYFYSLDHLITLHQRKCDELKKMKKFMLQNMFI
ncbi:restriction endonuclease subunit S [Agathobacter rectalis]|jgi:type I restriction enzyme S subunit|uniref:Restriction endonuclease subunit S n=2 Tax=Agathobacter rectalis TaxID=39491 RepID=A0A413DPA5_9FIRM|nr:restriction endonuclease subunit S [Agathobacter rectalis]RGW88429.1 restriction endonuclease subunit S [Agathobacter rectalis]